MARISSDSGEKKEAYRPSQFDMDEMKKELAKFPQKVHPKTGRLMSPLDQWLISQRIRTVNQAGLIAVFEDRVGVDVRYAQINAAMELREWSRDEALRYQHPELRQSYLEKIRKYMRARKLLS